MHCLTIVLGITGQMGGGIAQLAAMKGLDVILCDMHKAALERSIATTNRSLHRLVQKQQLTQEQADSASSRIRRDTDMQVQCPRASLYCHATCSAVYGTFASCVMVNKAKRKLARGVFKMKQLFCNCRF